MAGAERGSEHPLAGAIVAGARERGIEPGEADEFEALAGLGLRATVGGRRLLVGNAACSSSRGSRSTG